MMRLVPLDDDVPVRSRRMRSLFFVPGDRADMIGKALSRSADATVVDWEDAVSAGGKAQARDVTRAALPMQHRDSLFVRINPIDTDAFEDDVAAALELPVDGIVLPKAEEPAAIDHVAALAGAAGRRRFDIVLGIETAVGVARCRELFAAGAAAGYFGAEDYIADIGGVRTDSGAEVLYARSEVVLAARLGRAIPVDQAVVAYRDDDRFRADALAGRALGYQGKICIHPRQVELAHEAFTPGAAEVDRARRVVDQAASGVGTVDGEMIDGVHVRMARAVLARAGIDEDAGRHES